MRICRVAIQTPREDHYSLSNSVWRGNDGIPSSLTDSRDDFLPDHVITIHGPVVHRRLCERPRPVSHQPPTDEPVAVVGDINEEAAHVHFRQLRRHIIVGEGGEQRLIEVPPESRWFL